MLFIFALATAVCCEAECEAEEIEIPPCWHLAPSRMADAFCKIHKMDHLLSLRRRHELKIDDHRDGRAKKICGELSLNS